MPERAYENIWSDVSLIMIYIATLLQDTIAFTAAIYLMDGVEYGMKTVRAWRVFLLKPPATKSAPAGTAAEAQEQTTLPEMNHLHIYSAMDLIKQQNNTQDVFSSHVFFD